MILNKCSRCYNEGKDIGFVHLDYIDGNGKKHYKKCPGNENTPGKTNVFCLSCPYLDKKHSKKRAEKAEEMYLEHRLRLEGVIK